MLWTLFLLSGCSLTEKKVDEYQKSLQNSKTKLEILQQKGKLHDLHLQLTEALLTCRTHELQFALNPSDSNHMLFFKGADTENTLYEAIKKCCTELADTMLLSTLEEMHNSFYNYAEAYRILTLTKSKLGYNRSTGAQWYLRSKAHSLSTFIDSSPLLSQSYLVRYHFLTVRTAEKNYLLYHEQRFADKLLKQCDSLSEAVNKVAPQNSSGCSLKLSAYKKAFSEYEAYFAKMEKQKESVSTSYKALIEALHQFRTALHNLP